MSFERIEDLYPQLINDEIDPNIFNDDFEQSSVTSLEPVEYNPTGPTCHLCDKVFRRNKHLRTHMSIHQTTRPHQCNICPTSFKTVEYLNRHMNLIHGNSKKPHPCDKCDYQANSKIRLRDHMAYKHSSVFEFPCQLCDKKFKVDWVLRMHVRKWHHSGPTSCDVCGKVYPNEGALFNHQVKKHKKSDKNFPCSVCKQILASQKSLDTHMKLHETKHCCEYCGKVCKSQNNLKNHLTTHNDEKNYSCPICDSEFTLKGAQQVHMLTHLGEKPYVCDVCGKRFTQRSPMMLHRRKLHPDVNSPPPPKIKIAELLEKVQRKIDHKIRKNRTG